MRRPVEINGFDCYAPDQIDKVPGYNQEFFQFLFGKEEGNFRFEGRNEIFKYCLEKYFPHAKSFHEIGCGTGFVLKALFKYNPKIVYSGSEVLLEGLKYARKRLPKINLYQLDARDIPFESKYDVIGAFDVLEHIDEDVVVLKHFYKALNKRGGIMLSVPQHKWLWSPVDVHDRHYRRYSRKELFQKLKIAGFKIKYCNSFMTLLLPLVCISRLFSYLKHNSYQFEEMNIPLILNSIFKRIIQMELRLIKINVKLPLGNSLLVIAEKNG